jgi:hypothetical protein
MQDLCPGSLPLLLKPGADRAGFRAPLRAGTGSIPAVKAPALDICPLCTQGFSFFFRFFLTFICLFRYFLLVLLLQNFSFAAAAA